MLTGAVVRSLILLVVVVHPSQLVCVDLESETNAVVGNPMKLMCISCMKREEITPKTEVEWSYEPPGQNPITIYRYNERPLPVAGPWHGRLLWNGSKDLQDVSISIRNVTLNDTGKYQCVVSRQFVFDTYKPLFHHSKVIHLVVREEAMEDKAALYSEIMMYVLLVFLTCWLLVEMVYCYRKISRSDEQTQDNATNYLALPSEQRDSLPTPATQ
ncbi:sodium channel subunit beta-3 [Osmerus mordax]|uniref:sodium channel subunit beta-3 n=1 Tax=Osmerus mordax TaxID=8014 RepID=UPI00350F9993